MLKISYAKKSTSLRFLSLIFLFLFSNLGFSNLGYALGLGDIELKSHLNEALNARISLSDAEATLDPGCFTASDASEVGAFKKAYISLKKSNGVSQLYVITYDIITEPIVNLLIAFHCDPTISREYVLLMDPVPATTSPEVAVKPTTEQIIPAAVSKLKRKTAKPQTEFASDSATASTGNIPEEPVKKKRKKRATSVEDKLAEAYTGKSAAGTKASIETKATKDPQPTQAPAKASTDKPYLVISGGDAETSSNNQPNLSLRMETRINFDRTETAPLPTSAEEADEVTVMTNRLAHLEKQILSLQAKNTLLQSENEKIKNESFSYSPAVSEWLYRILIGLGIIAILAIAELLRRKIMLKRLQQDEAVWFDAEANHKEDLPDSKNIGTSIFNEPTFGNSSFPRNETNQSGFVQAESSEVEDVLDHADVFIEHGRPALAIQLLQTHLEDAPAESPAVWLKLLELLAKVGSEADYEVAVKECNQFFNIKMPSFSDAMNQDYSTLEDHPHIITRLEGMWGSQYAIGFLNDLIYNQQSQPREGFERNTFEELFFLKQIATILQADSPIPAAAYKPEVVKPLLENVEINRTLFAPDNLSNTDSSFAASDTTNGLNEDYQLHERTSELPAYKSEDRFADSEDTAISNADSALADDFTKQDYEIDMVLDAEESPAELNLPITMNFEEIDFDVSHEEIEVQTVSEETENITAGIAKTNFDLEESDGDIINKYLSQTEEKAKNKKKVSSSEPDDNLIEFDWDLPKIHKD